jgi:DNA-binding transcriptional LysR family regulator
MTTVEWPRGRLLDGIRNGDVDVAIVAGELKEHDYPSLSIWSERIVVALPASHPLATREALYWTDLKGQSFVVSRRDPGPDIADIVAAKLSSPGDMPHIESCDMSNENVLALLATGRGVSAHCESAVGLAYTGIVYREARDISGPTYIRFTAYWRNDNRNPTLARFLDLLRKLHAPLAG